MTSTHILYLHGFRSSPASNKASAMAVAVKDRFPGAVWCCPALPPSPSQAMEAVLACVRDWPHETMAVVGSSLGGFYATWLAEKLGCKAALLNPAVYPARDLASQLGEHAHWHDPQQNFVFETMHVQELKSMELAKITQPARYFAVIAKGDEVLDWHEMAGHYPDIKMKLLPASDHALSDFDEHLGDVLDFLDH